MTVTAQTGPTGTGDRSLTEDETQHQAFLPEWLISAIASFAVIGGLVLNLFLCFVNTRIMPVSDTHVMLGEMTMLGAAFLLAVDRRPGLYLTLLLFVSYMLMIFALRGALDLKALRDIFIPVGFYFMGRRVAHVGLADRLVIACGLIVLTVALYEYLALESYLDYFNVLGYYIARGTVTLQESFGQTRGLFISGLRPEPRTLLPFLGQHRVSSVFLEPVSAGNFGVILYAWALFRPAMPWRFIVMALAMTSIVLADARFGFFTCVAITLLWPLYRFIPKTVWLVAPFLLLAVIAAYGLIVGAEGGANDLSGRLKVTAGILNSLDFQVVLGAKTTDAFTADSGISYTLTNFGLFGFVGLWAAFVLSPMKDPKAWAFRGMMVIYLLLLMLISNSFYSIKTAALMWFLIGTADAVDWTKILAYRDRKDGQSAEAAEKSRR
ncbi:UDP-phosphate alpha N-acetylglucosaminyltransferase [Agrobacterium vitis]|uniref:UDP-phosphate alpha N-acetylglucosaminyltransferase n=1 Tax=Rhizobium/Agrobacterium group TaxID=227290 RepID=UPI0012E87528|nr:MULTISPECIES: UDP-phosphate alpha N-acetylglucosaminyltransferase [Rhizobium/Agrobacterium group]MCF1495142.1 UDP-phosphate alpha N-acetylglucosaminyltransferase [Allorhizobium ampelinum]MVA48112.1 UDP-phosphate alpha N-acetylglucosaminyltransferase [Agrobacterium vitis]